MNRIIRLDEETISKISAGEVILRPSNVVKELIENSLDAGANLIEVEISKGGKELIRVSDNGCGISREDLPLTIERFTTSKIKDIEDLSKTLTMGFRGEALASIAAVAKMTIISSTGDSAYKMEVENSKIISIAETSLSRGTTVIVRDLFYNTPVRKKFLKTDQTEMISITDTLIRYVLARPDIHFRFISSGRLTEEYFPQKEYLPRMLSVFRECTEKDMREYSGDTEYISLRFVGSNRNYTRSDQRGIYTYVNGRFVKDQILKKAIIDAYSSILPPQKFPLILLFLNIDPSEVDINVHPQKTEVRFKDTNRVYKDVYSILSNTIKEQTFNIESDLSPFQNDKTENIYVIKENIAGKYNVSYVSPIERLSQQNLNKDIFRSSGFFSSLKILGQLQDRFIILSSRDSIVIIDQHAAQERILFNNIVKYAKERAPSTQRMLIPLTIELNRSLLERLKLFLPEFERTGFEIEIFSDNTVIIKGIPAQLNNRFSEDTFIDIINSIDEEIRKLPTEEIISEIASKTACHASVRGRRPLNDIEIQRLLIDMDNTDFSIACPHGRPVYFEIKIEEIEKRFERR